MNMEPNALTYKGFGRVYVESPDHIPKVIEVMRLIDDYEVTGYMPSDLIAEFSEYPSVVYTGKFDMDMDLLTAECWKRGMRIWCIDNGRSEFIRKPWLPSDEESATTP